MDSTFVGNRVGLWAVVLALLVLLVSVNGTPYVPLQDYNEWVYQGFIAAQLLQGHFTGMFGFAHFPVPNSAVQTLLCLLNFIVAPILAARIVVSLYVVEVGS